MHAVMHAQCIVGNFGDIIAMKNVDNRRNLVILYYNIAAEQSSVSVILAGVFGALFAVSLLANSALLYDKCRTRHSMPDSATSHQLPTFSSDQSKQATDEGHGHYGNDEKFDPVASSDVTWSEISAEYTKLDCLSSLDGTRPVYEELRKADHSNI